MGMTSKYTNHNNNIISLAKSIIEKYTPYDANKVNNLLKNLYKLIEVPMSDKQFAAVLSFADNLGLQNLSTSTLLKCINSENFADAANEFNRWVNSAGKPHAMLIKRRKEESLLFLLGSDIGTEERLYDRVIQVLQKRGYQIYSLPYKLNLVGIRSSERKADKFDDMFVVFYTDDNGNLVIKEYDYFTTDPGTSTLVKPVNSKGTAIIAAGQYIDSHAYGLHRGYPALIQIGNITYYRDTNKNNTLEVEFDEYNMNPLGFKMYTSNNNGLNIHMASKNVVKTSVVGGWSAGCQVFGNKDHYAEFIQLIKQVGRYTYNRKYTYTLINSKDAEFKYLY